MAPLEKLNHNNLGFSDAISSVETRKESREMRRLTFTKLFSRLFAKKEMSILTVGLDAAGQTTTTTTTTTSSEILTTIPTSIVTESPSSSSSQNPQLQAQETPRGKWSKLLLFIPGALTFGLGTWQIFRRRDKVEMLEYRQRRLEMEPVKLTKVSSSSENLDSLEFRRILCKGVFDEKRSIYVGPRSRSISGVTENGYYLITPLMPIRDDPESVPWPILVNRGWVPRSWRDKSIKDLQGGEQPSNATPPPIQENESSWRKFWSQKPKIIEDHAVAVTPVAVVGVVRDSENPSIFVPANEPSSFQWFYVDVPAIARASGLPEDTIYIEDINENVNHSKPYPVPKDANALICSSVMPQDHMRYTLTWYSLSAGVTFMAFKRIRPRKSRR